MNPETACFRAMYVPEGSREGYLWTPLGPHVPRLQCKYVVLD